MNQPKLVVFATVLMSLGIVGCGGAEQLKTNVPVPVVGVVTDSVPVNKELPAIAMPEDVTAVVPPADPQPATPPPASTNTDSAEDNTVTPVATGQETQPAGPGADNQLSENEQNEPAVQSDDWWKPRASENLTWQWQLQGEIDTTLPVQVYNIDIAVPQAKIDELKARGIKLICYFSAGTVESFRPDAPLFPQEIIGEQYEDLVDEQWVDYANIDAVASIMRARIETCKAKGFDAIEIDNVDAHNYETFDEQGEVINIGTNFNMTLDESIAYVRWLTNEAHSRGLGIGLKNAEEMVPDVVDEVDWMLVEDCFFDSWCLAATAFIDADKPVFMAEYDELVPDFTPACELAKSLGYSAIWRDTSLSTTLYLACE